MTVSSETTRNDYTGNGVTTEFAYSFRIWSNTNLTVVTADEDGVESVLELTTDYTVTGAGQTTGGNVTLLTPLADGHKLTILSDIPALQGQKLSTQSGFSASVQEASLDKLTRIAQQNGEAVGRAACLPRTLQGVDPTLPQPLAGAALGWNADEDGLENILSLGGTSETALATLIRLYSAVRGNSDTKYKVVAGVLRQATAGGGWALLDDANHKPVNCAGPITIDSDGNLKVEYGFTASNKSGFVVGCDETFSELGINVGASVGNSFAIFQAYAQYGGAVGVGGVASQTALGQILNIAPYTADNNQIVDATNGWITVMHDSIAHASSNGSAVVTSLKGNHGFLDTTSTKTSFTLRYKRTANGVVTCPGSVPTMLSKSYVIPSFTPVTISTSAAGTSNLVLVTTSSDHGLYNDAPVIIAGHSVAGYNGTWNITVQSKTSFLLQGSTYSSAGTGGTVALGYTDWPYAGPWAVSTVTNSGGLQKVTTTAAHGLVTDMAVTVAGVATATTANGNWHITVIDSTSFTLQGSTYAVDGSGGTVTLPEVVFVTDHMAVNHPYAGADNPVILTKNYSATQSYSVELGTVTSYGFKVYFKDTATKAVITSVNDQMGFQFQRDVRLPASILTTIGSVAREGVHCNMNALYSSSGNFWFVGLFEVE